MVYLVAAAGGLLPNLLIQRYLDLLLLVHQIPRTYLHRLLLLSSASPLIFLFFLLLSLPPTFPLLSSSLLFSSPYVSYPLILWSFHFPAFYLLSNCSSRHLTSSPYYSFSLPRTIPGDFPLITGPTTPPSHHFFLGTITTKP